MANSERTLRTEKSRSAGWLLSWGDRISQQWRGLECKENSRQIRSGLSDDVKQSEAAVPVTERNCIDG